MKAVLLREGTAVIEDVPKPQTKRGEVRIRVTHATICRTDLYVARGLIEADDGRVLGHEFSGIVEELGEGVEGFAEGDHVVVNPALPCGSCGHCDDGEVHHCGEIEFLSIARDGAFAEFVSVPSTAVHALPDGVGLDVGPYAEPVAATMAILDMGLERNWRIAVTGTGRIASLAVEVLRDDGFLDIVPTEALDQLEGRFDAVVETGIERGHVAAILPHLVTGGALVIKSRTPTEIDLPLWDCVRKQIKIRAAHYGPFGSALEYLQEHSVSLAAHLGESFPLSDFEQAFRVAEASEERKITLVPVN